MTQDIVLKYYASSAWQDFTFYYTNAVTVPEITKISGRTKSGKEYQYTTDKRYTYKVNLFLSSVSPYSTTIDNQKVFLYNFLSNDQQRINFGTDIDVTTAEGGLIQLDLVENSIYINTITLNFTDIDAKTGAFS